MRKVVFGVLVVVIVSGGGAWLALHKNTPAKTAQSAAKSATAQAQKPVQTTVSTTNYQYAIPTGWAQLSSKGVTDAKADSGVGKIGTTFGQFTIAVEPPASSPTTTKALQDSTLTALKQLSGFQLISSTTTSVNGEVASQYVYTYGSSPKIRQEMIVLLHKGNAYSLLCTADDTDFANQQADFNRIISSFAFKRSA